MTGRRVFQKVIFFLWAISFGVVTIVRLHSHSRHTFKLVVSQLTAPILDFVMLYANILLFLNEHYCSTRTRPVSTVRKVAKR